RRKSPEVEPVAPGGDRIRSEAHHHGPERREATREVLASAEGRGLLAVHLVVVGAFEHAARASIAARDCARDAAHHPQLGTHGHLEGVALIDATVLAREGFEYSTPCTREVAHLELATRGNGQHGSTVELEAYLGSGERGRAAQRFLLLERGAEQHPLLV